MTSRLLIAATLLAASSFAGVINVAPQATITKTGTLGATAAALTTLTDGTFLTEGTGWQTGTVWWSSNTPQILFTFAAPQTIVGVKMQADNNDTYRVDAKVLGVWQQVFLAGTVGGAGMRTRFGGQIDNASAPFTAFTSTEFRVYAQSGDGSNSLSEVQLFANAVPEPSTFVLLGAGLAGLAFLRRR